MLSTLSDLIQSITIFFRFSKENDKCQIPEFIAYLQYELKKPQIDVFDFDQPNPTYFIIKKYYNVTLTYCNQNKKKKQIYTIFASIKFSEIASRSNRK